MDSVCDFYGQNEMDGVRFGGGCYGLGLAWGSLQLFFHSQRATGGSFPGWFLPFKPACHD